jgi:Ca2+-binding RTX toxin-like protein
MKTSKQSFGRRTLGVETLESRQLCAGVPSAAGGAPLYNPKMECELTSQGALVITGTSLDDKVTVHEKTMNGKAQLVVTNAPVNAPNSKSSFTIERSQVKQISFLGEAGNDYFRYFGVTNQPLQIYAEGGAGNDDLWGAGACDTLVGGSGNDRLQGLGRYDLLWGGEGNDYVRGHDGDDFLIGGAGRDDMNGGNGNDILDGGNDGWNDILTGSVGMDSFREELYVTNGKTLNRDNPADFRAAQKDTVFHNDLEPVAVIAAKTIRDSWDADSDTHNRNNSPVTFPL